MAILKMFVVVIVLVVGIVFYTLYRNGAHLSESPGAMKRLGVFLSINSATTSDDHPFAELRTPVFAMDAGELYQRALNTGSELGWGILANDKDRHDVNFIVRSPVFLFEDDVYLEVKTIGTNQSSLYMQSSSRTGRADFAANSGNIQKFVKHLKAKK